MTQCAPPSTEDVERVVQNVMSLSDSNNDKKISLPEFMHCITKNKEILTFLRSYSLISKDDLRPNFGQMGELEVPECDSDLELELVDKGNESYGKKYLYTKSVGQGFRIMYSERIHLAIIWARLLIHRSC